MFGAVDLLASEYSWPEESIFNLYIDRLLYLTQEIEKRQATHYLIMLKIVQNPHTEKPQTLFDTLLAAADPEGHSIFDEELDRKGMDRFKEQLQQIRGTNVKVK